MTDQEILAQNLVKYRKTAKLTQAELSGKINYSDKAVSKWERGECAPDIFVLKQIANLYGITVDKLLVEQKEIKFSPNYNLPKKRFIIAMLSVLLVWLVAVACYAFISLIFPTITETWMFFIYALPITFIVALVLTSVWGRNLLNCIISSLLTWTVLLAVYLSLYLYLTNVPPSLWLIFLIGIPLQFLIILWFAYKRINKKSKI